MFNGVRVTTLLLFLSLLKQKKKMENLPGYSEAVSTLLEV